MLIIHSGWGLIVFPFALLALMLGDYARAAWALDNFMPNVAGVAVFAILCIVAGTYLNRRPGVLGRSHLFFINLEYIGYFAACLAVLILFGYKFPEGGQPVVAPSTQTTAAQAAQTPEPQTAPQAVAVVSQPLQAEPVPVSVKPSRPVTLLTVDWSPGTDHDPMTGLETKKIEGEVTFSDGTTVEVEAFIDEPVLIVRFATFGAGQPKTFQGAEQTMRLRVRIGDGDVTMAEATKDYTNRARIFFWGGQTLQGSGAGGSSGSGGGFLMNWLALTSMIDMSTKSAGAISDLLAASTALVELTLADSSTNIVDLSPKHPVFHAFLSPFLKPAAPTRPAAASPDPANARSSSRPNNFPSWCANGRVRTSVEKAICADPQLGAADLRFAELYNYAINIADDESRARAMQMIRSFRKAQRACDNINELSVRRCLSTAYGSVVGALSKELGLSPQ